MTLTFELDLDGFHGESARHIARSKVVISKVIVWIHTHRSDSSTWVSKVVDNNDDNNNTTTISTSELTPAKLGLKWCSWR